MPKNKIPEPTYAINYVKRKLPVATGPWDQLKHGEHVHAFTVAHSAGAAVVEDIFQIMANHIEKGTGLGGFKRDMRSLMAAKGWYGRPDKTAKDKKYINWRLDTIYQTNILTAYSAGETREMLKTTNLYPYWQYKQVQRSTKRQSHSQFHNRIFRYDDPFWGTGTPPNGWGCQCYRNQLTESQAKAQGGPSNTPSNNIIQANIPKEWRYDPGREMLAPNFTRYDALRQIKYKGKSAISSIMNRYRKEMSGYELSKAEWNIYVSNLPDESLAKRRLYADAPMMFGTLRPDAADAIGEDVKLMVKDRSIIHGSRKRTNTQNNFSMEELKRLPTHAMNPEAIFKDNTSGNLVFHYNVDKSKDARVVFIPGKNITSMVLHTFFYTLKNTINSDPRYSVLWKK